MVDKYELKHGKVEDRSIFDGEIVVPVHLKNNPLLNSSRYSTRLHGGLLGSLTRSRTFLNLSTSNLSTSRDSIHGSVPDLSRSVPNTPNSNHKLSSNDTILNNSVSNNTLVLVNPRLSQNSDIEMRRKSEDGFVDNRFGKSGRVVASVQYSSSTHSRNSSEPKNVIKSTNAKKPPIAAVNGRHPSMNRQLQSGHSTPSLVDSSLGDKNDQKIQINRSFSKWGDVRGSNSFANDLNVNSLSTFSLPRVSIDHASQRNSKLSLKGLPKGTHFDKNDSAA